MIQALPLGAVIESTPESGCSWPGCTRSRNAHGLCDMHRLRVQRGVEPGCETPWEQLVAAALQLADAETDRQYRAAEERLKRAALTYRRARRARRTT